MTTKSLARRAGTRLESDLGSARPERPLVKAVKAQETVQQGIEPRLQGMNLIRIVPPGLGGEPHQARVRALAGCFLPPLGLGQNSRLHWSPPRRHPGQENSKNGQVSVNFWSSFRPKASSTPFRGARPEPSDISRQKATKTAIPGQATEKRSDFGPICVRVAPVPL
jgi:hypothetical protein